MNAHQYRVTSRGILLFAAMGVIWGMPYLFIRTTVSELSPAVLVLGRTALGALILLPLALRGGALRTAVRAWRPLIAFAVVEVVGPWYFLSDAERRLPSALTGLLISITPIVAVLVARFTGDERRVGVARLVGLGVGMAGVAVLGWGAAGDADPWAVVEVLLAAIGYAVAPAIAQRRLSHVPPIPLTTACLAISALFWAGPAILTWPSTLPSSSTLASLAVLAVVCTALAFCLFFLLIREVGPARATAISYVNPVVAVAAGAVFLSEPLTPRMLVSGAALLLGTFLVTRAVPAAAPSPEHSPDPASTRQRRASAEVTR
ncbi:DMT family transporter [Dactylosporangium sp. NPDC000555]|uniref:DMT family transporter n=1 Tax=Dactylosporangium sp. NPDC000555 TaxID=3154260 RepID=UPI0033343A07